MLPRRLRLVLWVLISAATAFGSGNLQVERRAATALPQSLSWVPPVFPPQVAGKRQKGWVRLSFIVTETGDVTTARVVASSGKVFESAALGSVLKWRFVPGLINGSKAPWCMEVTLPFTEADIARWAKATTMPKKVSETLSAPPRTRSVQVSGNDPDYPDSLLPRRLSGEVGAVLFIDASGRVQDVKIVATTHSDFINPALAALKHWSFKPAGQGDLALPDRDAVLVRFTYLGGVTTRFSPLSAANISIANPQDAIGLSRRPSIVMVTDPVYPYDLLVAGKTGEARADFTIGIDGSAGLISVSSAADPEFGRALAAALECCLFDPPQIGHSPTPLRVTEVESFTLAGDNPAAAARARLVEQIRNGTLPAYTEKDLDEPLNRRFQVAPVYPADLRSRRLSGTAEIEFIIDIEGRCRLARIVKASDERFGWAAATAVERQVYDPPRRHGQPIDLRVTVPFEFKPPE